MAHLITTVFLMKVVVSSLAASEGRDELPKALEGRRELAAAAEGRREPRRTSQWSSGRSRVVARPSRACSATIGALKQKLVISTEQKIKN